MSMYNTWSEIQKLLIQMVEKKNSKDIFKEFLRNFFFYIR